MCVGKMVKETTIDRVIFSLVKKNGQTYTELQKSAKSNQNSLTISLKYLVKENILTKDENKKYFFSLEIRNKELKKLPRAYDFAKEFEMFIDELNREKSLPILFGLAESKLKQLLRAQFLIKMERYTAIKLTKRDKLEFDLYDEMLDDCLYYIFSIAKKADPKRTQLMKKHIYQSLDAKGLLD